jgi:hypothetical protein
MPARWDPRGVINRSPSLRPCSTAPSFRKLRAAVYNDSLVGGSRRVFVNVPKPSSNPRKSSWSNIWSNAARRISGSEWSVVVVMIMTIAKHKKTKMEHY